MPGILGVITKEAQTVQKEQFEKMFPCLYHEPNYITQKFSFNKGKCQVGHIALPLPEMPEYIYNDSETGNACIVSGELYNFSDLRKLLSDKGIKLKGDSDAELLLALYQEMGEDFLKELNGWFNVLINDNQKGKILLANDRHGFRPLFFYQDNEKFIFAPEVKAILAHNNIPRKLDETGVYYFLSQGTLFNNRTFIDSVKRMPSSTLFIFKDNNWEMKKYWSWDEYLNLPKLTIKNVFEEYSSVLEKAIPRYYKRGKPIISMTAGIDTRMQLASLTPDLYPAEMITYGYHKNVSDHLISKKIAALMGVPHHFIPLEPVEKLISLDSIKKTVHITDGMVIYSIPSMLLYINDLYKNKICLTGKFGNEMFHPIIISLIDKLKNTKPAPFIANKFAGQDYEIIIPDNEIVATVEENCRLIWYGNLAIESTFMHVRTPYMDNDIIKLAVQCPDELKVIDIPKYYITKMNRKLANIPTDKGLVFNTKSSKAKFDAIEYRVKDFFTRLSKTDRISPTMSKIANKLPYADSNITLKPYRILNNILETGGYDLLNEEKSLNRYYLDRDITKQMIEDHRNKKIDNRELISRLVILELYSREFVD